MFANAFYDRGAASEKKGDIAAALIDYQSYQRLAPNDPNASAAIARVKQKL